MRVRQGVEVRREKVAFFCLILPHSNVWFVKAYPRETTEAFLDGHVSAFAFLGGVPRLILYDNTTLAVARILGNGDRNLVDHDCLGRRGDLGRTPDRVRGCAAPGGEGVVRRATLTP